ncbi:MAG: LysM peptidoglycan-binding domain-containing protein [Actinobacteria bacterium]|nr:LysM peptidoglycan-binding domain-containing protein [Actinomycetota bacterium]
MSTSPTQLRLTTRGRLLLGASGLVVALSLFSATTALGSAAKAESSTTSTTSTTSTNPASAYYETITVLPGESLWSIAGQVDSTANKGDLVAAIIDLNGLSGSALQAGQRLRVPVASK